MATLKNFTLEGDAFELIGYLDQHGEELYDLSLVDKFNRRGLTRAQLLDFAQCLLNDVMWGGVFNTCAGDFTDPMLQEFQNGGKDGQQENSAECGQSA